MQTAFNFNTHKAAVQHLTELGFQQEHAEGVVEVAELLTKQSQGDVVTKPDLELAATKLANQIQQVESRLENKIDKEIGMLRTELQTNFKWLYVITTGLVIALLAPHLQNLINLIK